MIINRPLIDSTIIDSRMPYDYDMELKAIAGYVGDMLCTYRDARVRLEEIWTNAWAEYIVTDATNTYNRIDSLLKMNDTDNISWRHNINTGKAFDAVETVHAYLMGSLFPNSHWLAVSPVMPGYDKLARVLQYYLVQNMGTWKFMPQMASYIRQLLICGTSIMALPWTDKDKIQFETLDAFDVFFDPYEPDVEDSPVIRRIRKTRAQIIESINKGAYSGITPLDVVTMQPYSGNGSFNDDVEMIRGATQIRQFQGISVPPYNMRDKLTIYEYWGDIHLPHVTFKNLVVTVVNGKVARMVRNTYHCGKPFVIGTYTPVVRQPYGISALQPALGLLKELSNTTNQVLDGVELAINPMYTLERDSTLSPDDVKTEPGAVYQVDRHGVLQPIAPPSNNFNLGFQQNAQIEQSINNITGTGPLIGSAQPRGGERVTAEEIKSVRDAGGNRLLGAHKHVELTSLLPMLEKTLAIVQQFTKVDDVVQVPDTSSKAVYFIAVGPDELKLKYKVIPRGADHVIEEQDYVQKRISLLQTVTNIPGAIEKLDLDKILEDILYHWGFDDPTVYMKKEEAAAPEPHNSIAAMGGKPAQNALTQQILADGGNQMMENMFGVKPPPGQTAQQLYANAENATNQLATATTPAG